MLIATVGNVNEVRPRGVLTQGHATVNRPGGNEYILGTRTPARSAVALAPGVEGPDSNLGLRLRNRLPDAPWWSMSLQGMQTATAYGDTEPTSRGGPWTDPARHGRADRGSPSGSRIQETSAGTGARPSRLGLDP